VAYQKRACAVWPSADGKTQDSENSIASPQFEQIRIICTVCDRNDGSVFALVEEKPPNLGIMAGKEYVAQTPKGMARYRLLGTGAQVYRVMVVGTKEQIQPRDATLFLDSFAREQPMKYRPSVLSLDQILAWADAWHAAGGQGPKRENGPIPGSLGDTWRRVDNALRYGLRGLPGVRDRA
jgi:hypothetical protein